MRLDRIRPGMLTSWVWMDLVPTVTKRVTKTQPREIRIEFTWLTCYVAFYFRS